MNGLSLLRHRQFLFRTYLFLVAGLLVVAIFLDMGFKYLETRYAPDDDQWLASTFALVERELADVPGNQRQAVADKLSDELSLNIQLLQDDEIVLTAASSTDGAVLTDAAGNVSYLRSAPSLAGYIRIGPVTAEQGNVLLDWLPSLFYLSIFIVVGLWLRPLLRDLDLMTQAAQRFAADYREPLSTAKDTSQLTSLAKNLDDMSSRLSGLIRTQKELIAALSHEMRTPLARIRFGLAVLAKKRGAEQEKQLNELAVDVQEIDRLIATMLDYARLDHPDLRMTWQYVPADAWLSRVIDKCREPDKEISLEKDLAGDGIWMDPRLMELALSNLLTNACHYAKEQIRCAVRCRDERFQITVEDDGPGIPKSERDAIFKAFTRIDDSRNRDTGGYGLGLAIVARIASLHGGSVTAASSDGLGGAKLTLSWSRPEQS